MTPHPDHLNEVHKADRAWIWKRRAGIVFAVLLALVMAGVLGL
jgi:hypothetical protein